MQRVLVLASIALTAFIVRPFTASAGQASALEVSPDQAKPLAKHALECLRRAEDSTDENVKRQAYTEGRDYAQRALALDDRNPDAHFALFATQGRLQLMDGAVVNPVSLYNASRELDRALEIDPNHSDSLAAKGGIYRQLPRLLGGNLDKAEDYLTRSIALNPNAIAARIELAATYRDMGHVERCRPLLETAATIAEREGRHERLIEARRMLAEISSSR
jgi:tetratricopeptide (TPR) repeat protein